MRSLTFWIFLYVASATTLLAGDRERMAQVQENIRSLETVLADTTASKPDRARLEKKLEGLKQQLVILENRSSIEERKLQLRKTFSNQTRDSMRGMLQTVGSLTTEVEARQQQLDVKRAKAAAEYTVLLAERQKPPAPLSAQRQAELDELINTKNEEIEAIALQQDSVEYELTLINLAKKFREQFNKEDIVGARLAMPAWFDKRSEQLDYASKEKQLGAKLALTKDSLKEAQAELGLARESLANYEEDQKLYQRQSGFLRRKSEIDILVASELAKKQSIGLQVLFLSEQVEALTRSVEFLQTQKDLVQHQVVLLGEQMDALRIAYFNRLVPPLMAVAVMILTYLLCSRFLLPRFFLKEELFMARRLGRYCTTLIVTLIMTLYMLEDLRVIAATLGLVSAAIVIALQDVCISFFGWSVIMVSRKFVIGDRLEIDGTVGDVIDIQLLRTTLLEINNGLGVDQPTGRVVVIPNSFVFRSKVFNYSHCHPYVWEKTEITVTFDTPLADATELLERVLEEETREDFKNAQQYSTAMQLRYGVEDAEYRPKIYTRITENGITFSLVYVGHYRDTTTRNKINLRLITELEQNRHIQLAHKTLTVQTSTAEKGKPSAVLHSHPPFHTRPAAG